MTQEFHCNKCWQSRHIKDFSHKYDNGKKKCCVYCRDLALKNDKAEVSAEEVKKKNSAIPPLKKAYVVKRQELEFNKELDRLMGAYELENLL